MKVTELMNALPHRPPAVWVDEIGDVSETQGESFVVLRFDAPYMTKGRLRPSAFIEFIAQSFGYQQAARLKRSGQQLSSSSKAFLVSITKCTLKDTSKLNEGERLKIAISDIKAVGPITLFNAVVTDSHGTEYARASLKVYSET